MGVNFPKGIRSQNEIKINKGSHRCRESYVSVVRVTVDHLNKLPENLEYLINKQYNFILNKQYKIKNDI